MPDRIKLTEKMWEDFLDTAVDSAGSAGWDWFEKNYGFTYESFKKFLLDNQIKAVKYDACKNLITQVNGLLNENKQLKQKLSKIDKCTLHAGCQGNPQCHLCPIQKILKENID